MYILVLQVWLSKLLTGWPPTDGNYELLNSEQNIKTNYLKPVENDQKGKEILEGSQDSEEGNSLGEYIDFRVFSLSSEFEAAIALKCEEGRLENMSWEAPKSWG